MVDMDMALAINKIATQLRDLVKMVESLLDNKIVDNENATCDLSCELDERISDTENAICELSELIK